MFLIFALENLSQMFTFDLQRFANGTVVKIGGVINNVAVGDTFTVSGTNYRILSVESDSVTAMVDGTPAELGKKVVISDTKSIDGVTYQTVDTEEADSSIVTKLKYKLDINGNSVFVTVFENAIETVADSDGNVLSATDGKYNVGGTDFTLTLDNGIPTADYVGADSVAATLDTATYSFSVDSKPVEVVVSNGNISKVSVDSTQVGTSAGSYTVGSQTLNVSYANGSLTTETAPINSVVTVTPVTSYTVGNTTVTVDSSGKLSKTSATVDGHTATLTYNSGTKKITATYRVTTTSTSTTTDPNVFIVTLPDDSSVKVTIDDGAISTVTYNDDTINLENSVYTVTASDKIKYALSLEYKENTLTATATATDENITATEDYYTVAVGDASTKITVKDGSLYQDSSTNELTDTDSIYTVTVGSTEVKLTYDDTNGLKEYAATNVVDLSKLTASDVTDGVYTAKAGKILTGTPSEVVKNIHIAADATVTLSNVTITGNNAAGITCKGTATITLEGTNSVKGATNFAGIQAGGTGTTLIIKGFGSLTATGGDSGAGIGARSGGTCGAITINGGTVTATGGSNGAKGGAGIGTGSGGTCGAITISGGTVTANGGRGGAGIGSGTANGATNKCGDITISGGTVTAKGGNNGAGIGSGTVTSGFTNTCGAITITDGVTKVTATKGSSNANSIGAGKNAAAVTVTIGGTTGAQTENYTYMGANTVDLSNLKASDVTDGGVYTATNGKILTGTLSGQYKISIADGATVTLSNVTINGSGAAGITCLGTATIKLEGTNSVKGATNFAGIQAGGTGTTLTITGTGSLTANGGNGDNGGVGIGSGYGSTCGNIVIESGSVTATGGYGGAGIGSGYGSTCGAITINGGSVTANGGDNGAGIGSGYTGNNVTSQCGDITISGGTVTATGGDGAGIGSGYDSTCGNITITGTVTKVTATKGGSATNSIGKGSGNSGRVGTVTIGGVEGAITDDPYTYTPGGTVADISTTTTQTATINDTTITFTTTGTSTTYKIGSGEETTATIDANKFTFKVDNTDVTATVADGKVKELSYGSETKTANDLKTVTTTSTRNVNSNYDFTATQYTFAVNGTNVSVAVDSSGKMTYNGKTVTNNKITVGGVEVTLNVSGGAVTGATYLGNYSAVTDRTQVDVYTVTIDGQSVKCTFDANNQCNVTVNGKEYLVTKTADGATATSDKTSTGAEDSRIYLLEVGGEQHFINCTFDASGNLTGVTSDDEKVTVDGTTVKIGDYTVEVGGTRDALTTAATETIYGEAVEDVEVNQLFTLSGVKSTDGITVANGVVTLSEANLNGETVTIDGDGYTLALDKNYPVTSTPEHFDGNVYKSASNTAGYEVSSDAKKINYTAEVPATDLFTLSGVKSTDGITVANGVVTLSEANLNGEPVTITGDGYTLALDKNYSAVTTPEHFDGNVYKSASNTDGYEISDDAKSISYTSEVPETNLFTLSGVKSTDGITVDNNVVTLSEANLNGESVTITGDGYTLALDKDYSATTTPEHFDGNVYKSASNTAGYKISDDAKSISYTAAIPETNLFTLSGVKSTDGITVANGVVTLTEANLNGEDVTISGNGYTLALDKDYSSAATPAHFDGNVYKSAGNTAGYKISDDAKSISYTAEVPATDLFTLSGVKSTDGITVVDNVVTLTEANLNGEDVTISGDGYTLALDKDYSAVTTPEHFDGTTYKSASNTAGYEISDDAKSISYTAEVPETNLFTLSGVKSTDGITVDNNVVTLSEANLNGETVTITSDGYTLALDKDYSSAATPEHFDGTTYKSASNTAGYEISDDAKSISYTSEVPETNLFTLSGVKSTDGITVDNNVVTLSEANLNGEPVTILGDGYTLALDKDYSSAATDAHFDGNVYKSASNTAGYEISDDAKSISYTAEVPETNLFTLSGVKSTDGITVANGVVTLTEANLNGEPVTISGNGYTLALDKDYSSAATDAHFDGNVYKSASNTAGYEISDDAKSISYTAEVPETNLFTLSGVKSTDGITVTNGVVTLSEANLNGEPVTITGDGYTLALDKNYSSTTTPEHFDGNVYKSAGNTAGYEISDDAKSISYTAAIPETNLFTLSGVKSTDGITVDNGVVTLSEANLNGEDVTVTGDGYTLALANGITAPTFDKGGWKLSGSTATYTSAGNTDGYTVSDDAKKISYTAANEAEILVTVNGVKSIDGLKLSGNVVTVSASSLDGKTVTISDGYTLAIADDVAQPEAKGKTWEQLDDDTYLYTDGGTTAGYTLNDNRIVYSDEVINNEQFTIKGAANTELISQDDGNTDVEQVEEKSLNRKKVVLIETQAHDSENQLAFYDENYARVTVSSGKDSLITYDNAHSYVDMTKAEEVTVVAFNGTVELKNYNIESGSVVLVQDVDKITDAIKTDLVKLVGNKIQINRLSRVAINSADNDSTLVKLTTYDGETQTVGFTGINGGVLNASNVRENLLLKGNYAETSSAQQNQAGSTILGGAGNDTILAGSSDFVDGGDGENEIYLTSYNLRKNKNGAKISFGGSSQNTVNNFNEGFDFDSDILQVENYRNVKFNFGTSGLLLRSANSQLLLNGIGVKASSADAESNLAADSPEMLLLTDGQSTLNAVVAQAEQNVLVPKNEGITPNAFFGNRSGLNFSDYNGAIEVNLSTETGTVSGRDAIFRGINKVQAGDGFSILIGSDEANTLVAGNGYTSLNGGAGNDELFGRSSSVDKDGRTTFFFRDGDGHDVIYDFEFLTDENKFAGTADEVNYFGMLEKVFCDGNNVVLHFDDETSLVVANAAGKDFQVNNLVAKVAENIIFDGVADYYRADGGTSVSVASGVTDAEIWLDNSHDTKFYGDLKILDASAVEGKTSLVGNENDNTIIAGRGDSSLWGGNSSSNDLLIGGESQNTFFYCLGNGNDTITGANDGDNVILNVSLAEISETKISGDGVTLNFIDGGSLRIEGTADITYQLVDGSKYSVNQETRSWENHA